MQSLPNLLKLNAFQNVKKLDFTTMSLDELKTQSGKFENLSKDTKLVNSLPDKGAKINEQLKLLQDLIAKKSSSSEQKDEENPTPVEELSEKLEGLVAGDKEIKEQEEEVKREINYFEKIKYAKTSKNANKIDMDKYQQVKEKILKKSEPVVEVRKTKPISIEECVKLLKEQEKTVQEFQMNMASEFLAKNQSETYNYSFAEKELGENGLKKYRENREEEHAEDDESEEEEEEKEFFENVD